MADVLSQSQIDALLKSMQTSSPEPAASTESSPVEEKKKAEDQSDHHARCDIHHQGNLCLVFFLCIGICQRNAVCCMERKRRLYNGRYGITGSD